MRWRWFVGVLVGESDVGVFWILYAELWDHIIEKNDSST